MPASLQRSAVLQALEEEERQKQAHQPSKSALINKSDKILTVKIF